MDQLILDQAINDVIMEEDGELDIINDPAEFDPGMGFDEDSSDSDSEYGHGTDQSDSSEGHVKRSSGDTLSQDDQLYMIHMRSFLDQLQAKVSDKTQIADKIREELKKCQERILELEVERDTVYEQTKTAENDENISELHRLIAHHDRICEELGQEGNMCEDIKARLEAAEYELNKAEVERGKFFQTEFLLEEKEMLQKRERSDVANRRMQQEIQCAEKVEHAFQNHEKQMHDAIVQRNEQNRVALETISTQQKFAKRHLASSLGKLKEKEDKHEVDYKNYHQQRMDMLIQLKSNISNNRENLKAIHARDKAKGRELDQIEMKQRDAISAEGGNPDETMLVRKRLEEFDKQQRDFLQKQKKSHAEIMQKVIAEEKDMKKRKKMQPNLYVDPKKEAEKIVAPHKRPIPRIIQDASDKVELIEDVDVFMTIASSEEQMILDKVFGSQEEVAEVEQQVDVKVDDTEDENLLVSDIDDDDEDKDDSSDDEPIRADESVCLAQPEFEGLWNVHKSYTVPDDIHSATRLPAATKMEKEILQKVLDKHRAGIVNKQVVAGREFKGCPFNSKPDVIHFKDFTVGKTYKQRVVLTNVSYSINYCKYLGVTEHLKDFIEVVFNPPGQLSAGMTTDIMVTFKPMINDDLFGEVHFLAQSAPFSIPLKCTTKKCDLSVDSSKIEFGTAVIGETLRRTLTLVNKGAQGTKFDFYKLSGMKHGTVTTADTSLGRLSSDDSVKGESPAFDETASKPIIPVEQDKTDNEIQKPPGSADGIQPDMTTGGDQETEDPQQGDAQTITDLGQSDIETHQGADDLHSSDLGDIADLCGMKVGPMSTGLIPPFSSVKLEIIWCPTVPGRVDTDFIIAFEDPLSESIAVRAFANAVDVPVWVERECVDLKICMFDRLYQDTIIVNNRATTALRLKFEVCKELRNHLELLPKTGYIQAQSSFSAQLKFLPRQSLFEDVGKYFDKETGVLEAQLLIRVADQTKPVPFMVQAVITGTDLEFSVNNIDFGAATIYESVKTSIKLTNKSILSQQFGFLGHPEYVSVQPNDGFGTLLPLETISLDVIFSPKKARDYKFELNCKSLINRDFKVQCQGTGVHPPLELSHQVINFAATSLYDISMATIHVINSHKSSNEFTHPVPRIGKGEIAPVGPTSFEFVVPESLPLSIAPAVGTVLPGQKSRVQIRFSPKLDEAVIRKEAVRMSVRQMEAKADREYNDALQKQKEQQEQLAQGDDPDDKQKANNKAKPKRTSSGKGNKAKSGSSPNPTENIVITKPTPVEPPSEDSIIKNSPPYCAAVSSLLRQFKGHFQTCVIPCYVASGACTNPGELPYSIHNTLYLEVHCPTGRPPVVVISDSGQTTTEFGDVSIGQHVTKSVTIQNISDEVVKLNSSVLNTNGPFLMLNAMRVLPPDGSHTILLSFKPSSSEVFHEVLEIRSSKATLFIVLSGKGVDPSIKLSVEDVLDMGPVLNGEYIEKTFQLHNISSLSVDYDIKLDSLSLLRYSKSQGLPGFINVNSTRKTKSLVGTQNFNGQCVFDSVPMRGSIPAGSVEEILVTFAPDHVSDHYSDKARIELFGQEESYSFTLVGQCKAHIMYIDGVDERTPAVESLAILPYGGDEEAVEVKPEAIPLLFTLQCTSRDSELMPASRGVHFGCVRTMAVSQKKSGEFVFDNVQPIMAKGFNIEPQKGLVEAGTKKTATITWTPPPGHDPSQPMDASIVVTLRGDVVDQYRLMLKGLVVSAPT